MEENFHFMIFISTIVQNICNYLVLISKQKSSLKVIFNIKALFLYRTVVFQETRNFSKQILSTVHLIKAMLISSLIIFVRKL